MEIIIEILASITMLLGALLILASGIGLVRLPDVFCRMHAVGKAGTLGIVMMITGTILFFLPSDWSVLFRGLLAIFFQFLTTPAATHLLARAAYLSDYPVSDRTAVDELKTYLPSRPDDLIGGAE
ncbi:MAG: monovalent cation/H(+) antiporter subunit G [Phycisphaeraceae bacterium]